MIPGLRPANERQRYFVTTYLIGWVQGPESAMSYQPNYAVLTPSK